VGKTDVQTDRHTDRQTVKPVAKSRLHYVAPLMSSVCTKLDDAAPLYVRVVERGNKQRRVKLVHCGNETDRQTVKPVAKSRLHYVARPTSSVYTKLDEAAPLYVWVVERENKQ
jgi:hypothetical protein